MARLKITDLPKDVVISKDEMKELRGGYTLKDAIIVGQGGESLPLEEVSQGHDKWIELV